MDKAALKAQIEGAGVQAEKPRLCYCLAGE